MRKGITIPFKFTRIVLPKELPFESGTNLPRQDECTRLTFQLMLERTLPSYTIPQETIPIGYEDIDDSP
ncbi:hypothetical protein B5M47_00150 [candidate division CPR3 bacterium 4484_211]|uniref:Uncharacterized protein n=1 Tax=candidate division CPR3 bacterium 4484_211 TaxID=1968527 RepID=A0A1W9NZN0_UNCC3|nr:MAG: hypothetical protein B5M47_00150 [candidate division CPR3 bacterium 4484_211]